MKRTSRSGRVIRPSSIRKVPSRVIPVSRSPSHVDGVDVPEAGHVDAALDRPDELLGGVGAVAAGQDEVGRRRAPGRPAGRVAWPVDRAPSPATAAELRSWTTLVATPAVISGSSALPCPPCRRPAAGCRRVWGVGQADGRRGDPGAEPAGEGPPALGLGEPVVGQPAEELQQQADGLGFEHDRVAAGAELGERGAARAVRRARAGDRRTGVDRPGGGDRGGGGVTAAAAGVPADRPSCRRR